MAIDSGKNFPRIGEVISVEGTYDPEVMARFLAPYEQYRDPATGLYHIPVPESEEEELARLRAEVARLRGALVEKQAMAIYNDEGGGGGDSWDKGGGDEECRHRARARLLREGLLPPE